MHFGDALRVGEIAVLNGLQAPGVERFVVDVQVCQQMRGNLALEVGGVAVAVIGMVQESVNEVKDLFLDDCIAPVMLAKLVYSGIFSDPASVRHMHCPNCPRRALQLRSAPGRR